MPEDEYEDLIAEPDTEPDDVEFQEPATADEVPTIDDECRA